MLISAPDQSHRRERNRAQGLSHARASLPLGIAPAAGLAAVEWRVEDALVPYQSALAVMETRAAAIADGAASELVWLIEHPPLYTAGTSAKPDDLIAARFPVHAAGAADSSPITAPASGSPM